MAAIQYAFFQAGGIGPNLGRLGQAFRENKPELIPIFQAEVARLLGVLERILSDGREYLAGPYSIGDIMHYPWLKAALDLKLPELMKKERVVQWLARTGARPAVERGMKVPS
jgi:GST-like protein